MTCKSANLIYCIKCQNCEQIYIGQTGNSLSERMRVHRQQIRDPSYRQIPLSSHLDTCSGGVFKIFPFYKMRTTSGEHRDIKEKMFIQKFIELKYLAISFTMDHKYFLCLRFTFMTHMHLLSLVMLAPSSGL